MRVLVLFVLIFSAIHLNGVDKLLKYKLEVQKKFPPQANWKKLKFDKSFSLNTRTSASVIGVPVSISSSTEEIYIVDNKSHNIKVFDFTGNFIRIIGQPGKGPGDLHYPVNIDFNNGDLYISSNNGIDIFNHEGVFQDRTKMFYNILSMSMDSENIYISGFGAHKGKPVLALQFLRNGKISRVLTDPAFAEVIHQYSGRNSIVNTGKESVCIVMKHWNRIFFYNKKNHEIKSINIDYSMGNEMEKWNYREFNPKSRSQWFSNYTAAAKFFDGKIFILLDMPALEIISLDMKGKIVDHYYNNKDFKIMRWKDFICRQENGKNTFYILSMPENPTSGEEMQDYKLCRITAGN